MHLWLRKQLNSLEHEFSPSAYSPAVLIPLPFALCPPLPFTGLASKAMWTHKTLPPTVGGVPASGPSLTPAKYIFGNIFTFSIFIPVCEGKKKIQGLFRSLMNFSVTLPVPGFGHSGMFLLSLCVTLSMAHHCS